MELKLIGLEGTLVIASENGRWCHVSLHIKGEDVALGAEMLSVVASKLLRFLRLERSRVVWVLSLSEQHGSIYGESHDGRVLLTIQNADARSLATLTLEPEHREAWILILLPYTQAAV
jgi:hypothetical protein